MARADTALTDTKSRLRKLPIPDVMSDVTRIAVNVDANTNRDLYVDDLVLRWIMAR